MQMLNTRWFQWLMVLAMQVLCVSVVAASRTSAAPANNWGANFMPNVSVTDQNGRELKFYDDVVKDRVVVINFVYTVCKDMCPLVTARLALLQEKLGDLVGRDIHFVSISIDPVQDTPEKLKQFADAFGVGPGWTFLTGTPENINKIRHKLGERSRALIEHRNELLLGNDRTGEWGRDSAFTDLEILANHVRDMDPKWLHRVRGLPDAMPDPSVAVDELPGQILFQKTCGSCHTLGKGQRVGPDLAGLLTRRDRAWVKEYMMAPQAMRARGDPIALELSARYRAVRMPNLGLSDNDVADLMHYLDVKSAPTPGHAIRHH
jgi:protein SCO1